MSFQKNPPWQKNVSNVIPTNFQQQMSIQQFQQQQQQQLINALQQQQQQQQQQFQQFHNPIIYPNNRINTMAFQQSQQPPPQQQAAPPPTNQIQQQQPTPTTSSKYNANLKTFSGTGLVSKVQNDIGFIDNEVLFHKNVCVKGNSPKLGDRVLVEAAYNQNMPFKWNATRVQVLSRSNPSAPSNSSDNKSYNIQHDNANSDSYRSGRGGAGGSRYSSERDRRNIGNNNNNISGGGINNDRRPRSRDNRDTDEESDRKRRRGGGGVGGGGGVDDRERPRQRDSMEYGRDRTKSPLRRVSPAAKRRRAHNIPRYMVQIPKVSLSLANIDVMEAKKRYPNLYIPSDFTASDNAWLNAFPCHKPFSIQKPCSFHIMKDVSPIDETVAQCVLDPPDADYTWSAKVMLLSIPTIHDIYKRCIVRAEDEKHDDSEKDSFVHPSRLISFLVGVRGKNETMAIGGPWSKKLDGENPESDPSVLIRTAIRTCKALTGIDLSGCTQWYRFVELKYRRSEQNKKEGSDSARPARIETVVIFLPDIHSCMPNRSEWEGVVQQQYKQALEKFLTASTEPDASENKAENGSGSSSNSVGGAEKVGDVVKVAVEESTMTVAAESSSSLSSQPSSSVEEPAKNEQVKTEDDVEMADATTTAGAAEATSGAPTTDIPIEADNGGPEAEVKQEEMQPTDDLDPKNLKVTELRAELSARNLSTKGLKNELVERLEQALKNPEAVASIKEEEQEVPMQQDESEGPAVEKNDAEAQQKDQDVEMNIAEMDISEVTVIDEYDSTKCDEPEEKATIKKKPEVKKMDEKERHMWEKKYQLPKTPHIIVHPSKTAKNGKFDCTVVSLSLLLDYRKDDTKEHSFEIALFAEAFNEMLMRDFGFNIYKAFNYYASVNAAATKKEDEKKKEASAEIETVDVEKSSDTTAAASGDKSKKSGDSDDQSDQSRKGEKDRTVKQVTAHPDLLLSFNYFDQTQCGYIFEKDIEELFFCLGLNLSRSQIRKITEKFITRDSLYYRKITDRQADAPAINPYENVTEEQLAQLARGNRGDNGAKDAGAEIVPKGNGNIVTFEGSTINLQQVMNQMKRAEAAYEENEKLLVDLKKSNAELKSLNHKNEKRIKDLGSDLKSVNRKLQDTESNLSSVNRKYHECHSALTSINDRIAPILARNERSRDREKEKEKGDRKSDKVEKKEEKKPKEEGKPGASEKLADKTIKSDKKDAKEELNTATAAAAAEKEKDNETSSKEKGPEEVIQEAVKNE